MSSLRGSDNYVWDIGMKIGVGGTSVVYQGVERKTGEPVAIKVLHNNVMFMANEIQMKEYKILKKVNHKNIIKLLALEQEITSGNKVIVMELCTGGSLLNILFDLDNTNGIEEDEFLIILQHLTSAVKHLRENNLIHRDLKPGNILKFIAPDGSSIYKLSDFDTARELSEGDYFTSFRYGTVPYLHPDLHAASVLGKLDIKKFTANVDLWSIGATLYQLITGDLPFRPYELRDKETMNKMTKEKQYGVISAYQDRLYGSIITSMELPPNCRLSKGLKILLTPLLAKLMESREEQAISFEEYFEKVDKIIEAKNSLVWVWYMNTCQMFRIYPTIKDPSINDICENIAEQTGVIIPNQVLLYNDKILMECEWPIKTTMNNPLILFNRDTVNITLADMKNLPTEIPTFTSTVNWTREYEVAHNLYDISYTAKRQIEYVLLTIKLIDKAMKNWNAYINKEAQVIKNTFNILELKMKMFRENYFPLISEDLFRELYEQNEKFEDIQKQIIKTREQLSTFDINCFDLLNGLDLNKIKQNYSKIEEIMKKLRAFIEIITTYKRQRPSHDAVEFYKLERLQIIKMCSTVIPISQKTENIVKIFTNSTVDSYIMTQTKFLQIEILKNDIENITKEVDELLLKNEICIKKLIETVNEKLLKKQGTTNYSYDFINKIYNVKASQTEIKSLLDENTDLVQQFQALNCTISTNVLGDLRELGVGYKKLTKPNSNKE